MSASAPSSPTAPTTSPAAGSGSVHSARTSTPSGLTGPPTHIGSSASRPSTRSGTASPTVASLGRFRTSPRAPAGPCSATSTTVRTKFGSSSFGPATRSWPVRRSTRAAFPASHAETQLRARDAVAGLRDLLLGEPGEPDAEQPHRPRGRVGAQEVDRDLGDPRLLVGHRLERPRARDRRPVVEPDLDPHGPAAQRALGHALGDLPREPAHDLLLLGAVGDVLVERRLARLGLRRRGEDERGAALEARRRGEPRALPLAEPVRERLRRGGRELGDRPDPHLLEPLRRLRADAGDDARSRTREPLARHLPRQRDEARGLLEVGGG